MAKGKTKQTNSKKENGSSVELSIKANETVKFSPIGELVSQKPKIIQTHQVQVNFNILGNTNVVYFELDDEKATISKEDRSKVISAVSNVLKSVDGEYIFNKASAQKVFDDLAREKIRLEVLENRIKLSQLEEKKSKESLEKIPKIFRNLFGA